MAVGSWIGTDIFPTLEAFEKIVERESSRSRKGKGKPVISDSGEDTEFKWKAEDSYE